MFAVRSAVRASPLYAVRRLGDAARKRDPTRSNDIRRRIATGLRQSLAQWRSQVYAAVVETDLLGYDYGDVDPDPDEIEDLIDRLDILLHRQAEFAFMLGADNMDVMLRTAYARGVERAGEEVAPVLPLTYTTVALINRARDELEGMLEGQITNALQRLRDEQRLAAAASSSRYKLYTMALLPLLLKPLHSRLSALSTTNVTRAFNAGKIDAYEAQGVSHVGIEAETQPPHRRPHAPPRPRARDPRPRARKKSSPRRASRCCPKDVASPSSTPWRQLGMTGSATYAKGMKAIPTRWQRHGS